MAGNEPSVVVGRLPPAVAVVELAPETVAGQRQRIVLADLPAFFAEAMPFVRDELDRAGVRPTGPPVAIYQHGADRRFDVTVGYPVTATPPPADTVVVERLPGGPAVQAMHRGTYETLATTYKALHRWLVEHQCALPAVVWEEYLVGPRAGEPGVFRTRLVCPVPLSRAPRRTAHASGTRRTADESAPGASTCVTCQRRSSSG